MKFSHYICRAHVKCDNEICPHKYPIKKEHINNTEYDILHNLMDNELLFIDCAHVWEIIKLKKINTKDKYMPSGF